MRWYADTALAIGLKTAVPERLRFFIAADEPHLVAQFQVRIRVRVRVRVRVCCAHGLKECICLCSDCY